MRRARSRCSRAEWGKTTVNQCEHNDNRGTAGPEARGETGAEKAKKGFAAFGVLGRFSQLGLSMCICALVGSLGGVWLDGLFGTRPALLIVGTLLGAAASFKVMYDTALKGVGAKPKKPLTGLGGERTAARYEAIRMDARRKADPTRAADRARVIAILTSDDADIDSATHGIDTTMPHRGIVENANAREYTDGEGEGEGGDGQTP